MLFEKVSVAIANKLEAIEGITSGDDSNLHLDYIKRNAPKPAISYSILYTSDNIQFNNDTSDKFLVLTVNVLSEVDDRFENLEIVERVLNDFQTFTGVVDDIKIVSSEANDVITAVDEETESLLSTVSFNIRYFIRD